jgi:hypothetical protein
VTAVAEEETVTPGQSITAPVVVAPIEDRYDFERGTILAVIQFRPLVPGSEQPREVWVSVQNGVDNKEDFPLVQFTTLEAWPQVLAALLEELRQDLPRRKLLHEQRKTQKKPASTSTAGVVRPATSSAEKPSASVAPKTVAAAPPPPVPNTTSPIPKGSLAMPGLFDEL